MQNKTEQHNHTTLYTTKRSNKAIKKPKNAFVNQCHSRQTTKMAEIYKNDDKSENWKEEKENLGQTKSMKV